MDVVTISEYLEKFSDDIKNELVNSFLGRHSGIYQWHYPDGSIIYLGGEYKFNDLDVEGKRLQSKLLKDFEKLSSLLTVLFSKETSEILSAIEKATSIINKYINQDEHLFHNNLNKIQQEVKDEFEKICEGIKCLYDSTSGKLLVVPDTNALISYPDIEQWSIGTEEVIHIVLIPTILSELDALKIDGKKSEEVRKKAKKLIKKIKEYIRRGDTEAGVDVVKGKIKLITVALEPDFSWTLPWLDKDNNDDRAVASFLEVVRKHSRSKVFFVTGDVNLMNKLSYARLPYLDVENLKKV